MEANRITWLLLTILASLLLYLYVKMKLAYQYWSDRGIKHEKPQLFVGNIMPYLRLEKSVGEIYKELYQKYPKEPVVGIYEFMAPVLIVRDPKVAEKVLVKDFQYFTDRTLIAEDKGLLYNGLFQMKGQAWRTVRQKISPAFTSGKLKQMHSLMVECTEPLLDRLDKNLNKEYTMRDTIAVFILDAIANTVFGIQMNDNVIRDEFLKMSNQVLNTPPSRFANIVLLQHFPKLASWLDIKFFPEEVNRYYKGLISHTLHQRENNNTQRNDYTQHLLKLKQQGAVDVRSKDPEDHYLGMDGASSPTDNLDMSEELLAGQAFQFLVAGFDPVLTTMQLVLYDLSLNPAIQKQVREHTRQVVEKHGDYSYDSLKDMTYLEQCIQETLRMHVLTPYLFRDCVKNYYLEEADLQIYKGQKIIIPLNAIQMDPEYHENPEVYNPERLPPGTLKESYTYLPFGEGPRICIGIRYAYLVMKLGLAKLLTNYSYRLSPNTEEPLEVNKQAIVLLLKRELQFIVNKI